MAGAAGGPAEGATRGGDGLLALPPVSGELAGEPAADLDAHRAARAALMTLLMDDPDVDALFERWSDATPFGRAARACGDQLTRMADVAGLESSQDLRAIMDIMDEAIEETIPAPDWVTTQDEADAIGRELSDLVPEATVRLDAMIAAVQEIDFDPLVPDAIALVRDRWGLPWPWLAFELIEAWGHAAAADGLGTIGTIRYGVRVDELSAPAPQIAFETRPGETIGDLMLRGLEEVYLRLEEAADAARIRVGRRVELDVVGRYVGWWYRRRIVGESLRSIAGKDDGKRPHVRKGITRAEGWLGAVGWTWADEDGGPQRVDDDGDDGAGALA